MHEGFIKENPKAVLNVSITSPTTQEVTQIVGKKSSKKSNKGKEKVHSEQPSNTGKRVVIEDEDEEESEPSPLIRKKGKKSFAATISNSIVPESIMDRPASERRSAMRATGTRV